MVAAGVTVVEAPVPPELQEYVLAPAAEIVAVAPVHMVAGVVVTVGKGLTVTTTVAVFVQPAAEVPVTVYVVVAAGETVVEAPVPPELQEYVFAPAAEIVAVCPTQMVAGVVVTVGKGFTVTTTVAVLVQPAAEVPVTE